MTLAVVPTYLSTIEDLDVLQTCLQGLQRTPQCDALVVDDGSPAEDLVDVLEGSQGKLGFELVRVAENAGFARTVNVGLRRALETGRDAVLVNADVEFVDDVWLARMLNTGVPGNALASRPSIVGGLLTYPNGLIQHAGIYFSLLSRGFDHQYRYGPGNLKEAQGTRVCPVTAALQLIRHECLSNVGLYDESFRMGFEDVDYCLRVFQSGRWCVFNSRVRAIHHESLFRSRPGEKLKRWQLESYVRFAEKWARQSFAGFVPQL